MIRLKITQCVILIGLALSIFTQNCANPNPMVDLIDSGKISLIRRGGNREHCFSAPIKYSVPNTGKGPDIAITTSQISGYNPVGGFDYSISAGRQGLANTLAINLQIAEDVRWTSIEVSYIVSSRTDIILGSFIGNMFSLTSCAANQIANPVAALETYVPVWRLNNTLTYKVATFISGFRTLSNNFFLRPTGAEIDKVDGRVAVTLQSNANPGLQYVYISYVVYPTVNNEFQFIWGNIIGRPVTYKLEGSAGFQQNNIQYSQFSICRKGGNSGGNPGQNCPNNQRFVNGRCECMNNYIRIQNGICYQTCGPNSYINESRFCMCIRGHTRNAQGVCMPNTATQCGADQVINPNGGCVCKPGFYRSNQNTCLPICSGANQYWTGSGCACNNGFIQISNGQCIPQTINCKQFEVRQGNECVCQSGFVRNPSNGQCVWQVQCRQNQIAVEGQCRCRDGYQKNNQGMCIKLPVCGVDQTYNAYTNTCDCKDGFTRLGDTCVNRCGINSQWMNGQCKCNPGMVSIYSVCRPCPAGSRLSNDGATCICDGNQVFKINGNQIGCTPCPQGSSPQNNECMCPSGWQWNSDRSLCIRTNNNNCPPNSSFNPFSNECACNSGFRWSPDRTTCIPNPPTCPPNSQYNTVMGCVCEVNFEWNAQRTACVWKSNQNQCPANAAPNYQGVCTCNSGHQWNNERTACVRISNCPPNSMPTPPQGICVCNNGYKWNNDYTACIILANCPPGTFPNSQGICVCNSGYYLEGSACKPIPTCPPNSQWNQATLKCVCTVPGQNLIGNICRACGSNQFWNSTDCVCSSGFNRIGGVCRTCPSASTYDGSDCICNLGYYGNRDGCNKCHPTCGKCKGPQANQCLTCADITFVLVQGGYCQKDSPCGIGHYLNGTTCAKCSDYCQICASQMECAECAPGFEIKVYIVGGEGYSACQSVCGDGKKNDVQQCDDGNKANLDGCSSQCKIEQGWSCAGGTSVKPSICSRFIPTRTTIEARGAVNMVGKVMQGVRLSYIPKCFTDRDCVDCFKILSVKVVEGNLPTQVKVSYVINNEGQFMVQYIFGGFITSTVFKYQLQINKDLPEPYKSCFSAEDYAQQVVGQIDTALLARVDDVEALTLESVTPTNSISLPPAFLNSFNRP